MLPLLMLRDAYVRSLNRADFRNRDKKLYELWEAHRKRCGFLPLQDKETAVLVSYTGDQMLFLVPRLVLSSGQIVNWTSRLQLDKGGWNPLLLKEYARLSRLRLRGLDRFEEHFKRIRAEHPQRRETNPNSQYAIIR